MLTTTSVLAALFMLIQPYYGTEPGYLPVPWTPSLGARYAGTTMLLGGGESTDGTGQGFAAMGFDALSTRWLLGGTVSEDSAMGAAGMSFHVDPVNTSLGAWAGYDTSLGWTGGAGLTIAPFGGLSLFANLRYLNDFNYLTGIIFHADSLALWGTSITGDMGTDWEGGIRLGGNRGGLGFALLGSVTRDHHGEWLFDVGLRFSVQTVRDLVEAGFTSGTGRGTWYTALWNHHTRPQPSLVWGLTYDGLLLDLSDPDSLDMARMSMKLLACFQRPLCRAVVFKVEGSLPLSMAEEAARMIELARSRGRFTMVYAYGLDDRTYAMASHADGIYMFPGTTITLKGIGVQRFYLLDFINKIGISAQLLRIGRFKSTPEMFTRNSPSPLVFGRLSSFVQKVEDELVRLLVSGRRIKAAQYRKLKEDVVLTPPMARQKKLIDGMAYPDEIPAILSRRVGGMVDLHSESSFPARRIYGSVGVCLLVLQGDIVSGAPSPFTSQRSVISDKEVASALRRCANDPAMAAVLIRMDSPGGSALASEYLWRKVRMLALRKPVVVSVGRRAASGGYYIAAGARTIVTLRSSVVGSIGVFGGKVEAGALLKKLGVNVLTMKRDPHADMETNTRPYTRVERTLVVKRLAWLYERFIHAVMSTRKGADPQTFGEGRVFLGSRAVEIGLADRTGSFLDALELVSDMAGLPQGAPVYLVYPSPSSAIQRLAKALLPGVKAYNLPYSLIFSGSAWTRMTGDLIF